MFIGSYKVKVMKQCHLYGFEAWVSIIYFKKQNYYFMRINFELRFGKLE